MAKWYRAVTAVSAEALIRLFETCRLNYIIYKVSLIQDFK